MKNRIGLRLLAISASAVVLLTASFGKQVSNTGCSERNIQDTVASTIQSSLVEGEVVGVEGITRNGNTFTVSLGGVVANDGKKNKVLKLAKNAVGGCAIEVNGTNLKVRCPSDPAVIERRVNSFLATFLPACLRPGIVAKASADGRTVVLKGKVPAGRANPNLQMTYVDAVVEVAKSAFCGEVNSSRLTPDSPGSAECVLRLPGPAIPNPNCPNCGPQCPPGSVSCVDANGIAACLEGTRCPRIN